MNKVVMNEPIDTIFADGEVSRLKKWLSTMS